MNFIDRWCERVTKRQLDKHFAMQKLIADVKQLRFEVGNERLRLFGDEYTADLFKDLHKSIAKLT